MILTGKAKEDIDVWLIGYYIENREDYNIFSNGDILRKHYRKTSVEKNALTIEWLDSVGIYILHHKRNVINKLDFSCDIITEDGLYNNFNVWLFSRQKATTEAIKSANKIYNEKHI